MAQGSREGSWHNPAELPDLGGLGVRGVAALRAVWPLSLPSMPFSLHVHITATPVNAMPIHAPGGLSPCPHRPKPAVPVLYHCTFLHRAAGGSFSKCVGPAIPPGRGAPFNAAPLLSQKRVQKAQAPPGPATSPAVSHQVSLPTSHAQRHPSGVAQRPLPTGLPLPQLRPLPSDQLLCSLRASVGRPYLRSPLPRLWAWGKFAGPAACTVMTLSPVCPHHPHEEGATRTSLTGVSPGPSTGPDTQPVLTPHRLHRESQAKACLPGSAILGLSALMFPLHLALSTRAPTLWAPPRCGPKPAPPSQDGVAEHAHCPVRTTAWALLPG